MKYTNTKGNHSNQRNAQAIKGKYLKRVHLSCTMGPSIPLQLHSVDPSGARFMLRL